VVELLDDMPAIKRPAPFVSQRYIFKSRPAAQEWLGIHEADHRSEQAG
jgi:hypothetical protein